MATWDDSESSEDESDSEDENANLALMATTTDDSDCESEPKEVFSEFTRAELAESLSELLENYSKLKIKYKKLKKSLASDLEKHETEKSELIENNFKLKEEIQNA